MRDDCSDRLATADVIWSAGVRRRERGFAADLERRIVRRFRSRALRGVDGSEEERGDAELRAVESLRAAGELIADEMERSAALEERHVRDSVQRIGGEEFVAVPDDLLDYVDVGERWNGLSIREHAEALALSFRDDLRGAYEVANLDRDEARRILEKRLNGVRNALRFLAATFVYRATAYARELLWQINGGRLRGVVWVSVLDERTTPHVCIPRAWKRYRLPNFEPIGHDRPWLSGPGRSHPRCRARAVFALRGCPWPTSLSGEKWLRQQSHAVQDEVLGQRRATLWRSKRYTLNQMIEADHDALRTLDELEAAGRRAVDVALDG